MCSPSQEQGRLPLMESADPLLHTHARYVSQTHKEQKGLGVFGTTQEELALN